MFGASDSYLFLMVPQLVARGKMGWTSVEVRAEEFGVGVISERVNTFIKKAL